MIVKLHKVIDDFNVESVDESFKLIELTQGYFTVIDEEDFELCNQFKWSVQVASTTCYAKRGWRDGSSGFTQLMHTLIMGTYREPIGVDHKNNNGLDNRRSNLRKATQHQNNGNYQKLKGASIYKGVCINTPASNWKAQINMYGTKVYLGSFATEEEAARKYDKVAKEHFGEFAQLNFPEES